MCAEIVKRMPFTQYTALIARKCVEAIHATVAHPGFVGDEYRMF